MPCITLRDLYNKGLFFLLFIFIATKSGVNRDSNVKDDDDKAEEDDNLILPLQPQDSPLPAH